MAFFLRLSIFVLLLTLQFPGISRSQNITDSFAGKVTYAANDNPFSLVEGNDIITTIEYDLVTDENEKTVREFYNSAISIPARMSIKIGELEFQQSDDLFYPLYGPVLLLDGNNKIYSIDFMSDKLGAELGEIYIYTCLDPGKFIIAQHIDNEDKILAEGEFDFPGSPPVEDTPVMLGETASSLSLSTTTSALQTTEMSSQMEGLLSGAAWFAKIQEIGIGRPDAVEYFTISNEHYLAVAKYESDSYSVVYKWNGVNFIEMQQLVTTTATDCEFFEIDGMYFLAFAQDINVSGSDGKGYGCRLYRWDGNGFVEYEQQPIVSTGQVWNIEVIRPGADTLLALSHPGAGSIRFYRWNGAVFSRATDINAIMDNVSDIENFVVDETMYLAGASTISYSAIYIWNGFAFVLGQSISQPHIRSFKYFHQGNPQYDSFLAAAVDKPNETDSILYKMENGVFVKYVDVLDWEIFPTKSAWDWESFKVPGDTHQYMIVANNQDGNGVLGIDSDVYQQQDSGKFELSHTVPTNGARDIESFSIGEYTYLAIANNEGGTVDIFRVATFNSLADFDVDGDVDGADFASFISAYTNNSPQADLNEDGLINNDDLAAFAAVFGN